MAVKKQTLTMVLTNVVIQEIMQSSGGVIHLSNSLYPDLDTVDTQYWKFHSPFGAPGDELIILEDYAIREVGQNSNGFYAIIEYKDGLQVKKAIGAPAAINPKGSWLNANTMPTCYSRCKVLIQDIQMAPDNSEWLFIVSLLNLPSVQFNFSTVANADCNCGCNQL